MLNTRTFIKSILLICSFITLTGCASVGNDSLRAETETSVDNKVIQGKTTKSEIKTMFGSPVSTTYTDGGLEIWKYELSKMSADANNFIPIVNLFAASSSGTKKELTILFDESDKVKKFNMSESPITVRTGLFNQ